MSALSEPVIEPRVLYRKDFVMLGVVLDKGRAILADALLLRRCYGLHLA